jgi:hypothetical protein
MTVKQLLDQKGGGRIITIGPHVEVLQAAQILRAEGIGALIVSRDGTTLVVGRQSVFGHVIW